MKVKELILGAKKIYFAGYCSCGCGERLYDLSADDGKVYQPIPEKFIKEIRPTLLENIEHYNGYGEVGIE